MEWLIAYLIGGFVSAGIAVAAVGLSDDFHGIDLIGVMVIFLFWPFILIGAITAGFK